MALTDNQIKKNMETRTENGYKMYKFPSDLYEGSEWWDQIFTFEIMGKLTIDECLMKKNSKSQFYNDVSEVDWTKGMWVIDCLDKEKRYGPNGLNLDDEHIKMYSKILDFAYCYDEDERIKKGYEPIPGGVNASQSKRNQVLEDEYLNMVDEECQNTVIRLYSFDNNAKEVIRFTSDVYKLLGTVNYDDPKLGYTDRERNILRMKEYDASLIENAAPGSGQTGFRKVTNNGTCYFEAFWYLDCDDEDKYFECWKNKCKYEGMTDSEIAKCETIMDLRVALFKHKIKEKGYRIKVKAYDNKWCRGDYYKTRFLRDRNYADEHRCAYCGKIVKISGRYHTSSKEPGEVDHIIPVAKLMNNEKLADGTSYREIAKEFGITRADSPLNLVASCKECNKNKGTITKDYLRQAIEHGGDDKYWNNKDAKKGIRNLIIIVMFVGILYFMYR